MLGYADYVRHVFVLKYEIVSSCIECGKDPALAWEQFKPNLYDLRILDINLPKINGFELYDQLKIKDSNIKTLFITGLSSVESYNTGNSKVYPLKGKRHFMMKPVSTRNFWNRFNDAFPRLILRES